MSADALLGRVLGGTFEIERPLGEGGFGQVYVARHVRTKRKYAVKVLRGDRATGSSDAVRRFRREADSLAALGHPGIVALHDFATTDDGIDYLVMDLLSGEDLAHRLERVGKFPLDHVVTLAHQIGAALSAAHGAGIVHRDLKPANVFLVHAEGVAERAMILDFGLAKMLDEATPDRLTASGVAMGTPQYMSPEQASGSAIDHRTDQYALASIVYEAIAGVPPFEAPTISSLMVKILTEPPPSLAARVPGLPSHVEATVRRALAKTPEHRFPDMATFLAALRGDIPALAETRKGVLVTGHLPHTREVPLTPADGIAVTTAKDVHAPTPSGHSAAPTPHATSAVRRTGRGLLWAAAAVVGLGVVVGGTIVSYSVLQHGLELRDTVEVGEGRPDLVAMNEAPAMNEAAETAPPIAEAPRPADVVADEGEEALAPEAPLVVEEGMRARVRPGGPRATTTEAPATMAEAEAAPPAAMGPAATGTAGSAPVAPPAAGQLPPSVIATYRATIAQYEPQVRAIDAYLGRFARLRQSVSGLGQGRRPPLCSAAGQREIEVTSDVPIIVSMSQMLGREAERICQPFDLIENPPDEARRQIEGLGATIDRAEAMTRERTISSNQPSNVADQIAAAIQDARRTVDGVEAGRRTFPCDAPVWNRLRQLANAGNSYSGAAAERVYRVRDNVCRRIGIDREQLAQSERQFLDRLDDAEGSLRDTRRSFAQIVDSYRAYVP